MDNKKILIIEDDLFLRELYARVLRKSGYTIIEAVDGEQGLEVAEQNPNINLILLDIFMPKKNGVETLRSFKSNDKTKNIPVLLLTNFSEDTIINEALKIGASGFLLKASLLPQQLVDKVEQFLKNPGKPIDSRIIH